MPVVAALAGILCGTAAAYASDCPGNPNALGTSRVIAVDPAEHARLGTMQYSETLPLADHEVVITFDDGPLPPYSTRALDILAHECVKVTYFLVGSMARAYPDVARRIYAEGHTIGTHSQSHPMIFNRMSMDRVHNEVENGINSVRTVLGNPKAVAPFFRIPGLARTNEVESYLQGQGLMTWSADFPADDWKHISANEIINRAIRRIEAKGRGILLLHDIQPATIQALPALLHELKARGYRIVHIVPAGADHQKTATAPQDWMPFHQRLGKHASPSVVTAAAKAPAVVAREPAVQVSPAPIVAAPLSEYPTIAAPAPGNAQPAGVAATVTAPSANEGRLEPKSELSLEFRPEIKSDKPQIAEPKPAPAVVSPDTLSATQSIAVPRPRTKLRVARRAHLMPSSIAPAYMPRTYLPPLVLSN